MGTFFLINDSALLQFGVSVPGSSEKADSELEISSSLLPVDADKCQRKCHSDAAEKQADHQADPEIHRLTVLRSRLRPSVAAI